jgi:hypothetical protein
MQSLSLSILILTDTFFLHLSWLKLAELSLKMMLSRLFCKNCKSRGRFQKFEKLYCFEIARVVDNWDCPFILSEIMLNRVN